MQTISHTRAPTTLDQMKGRCIYHGPSCSGVRSNVEVQRTTKAKLLAVRWNALLGVMDKVLSFSVFRICTNVRHGFLNYRVWCNRLPLYV